MKKDLAIRLLSQWLASWAAEEQALDSAARAGTMHAAKIAEHRSKIERERESLRPLLAAYAGASTSTVRSAPSR